MKDNKSGRLISSGIENVSQSFYDSFVQENAEIRASAGMKTTITRQQLGNCCEWCAEISGTYEIDKAPKDIYRRHQFCRCLVTVHNEKGYTDVWSKKTYQNKRNAIIAREKEILKEAAEKRTNGLNRKSLEEYVLRFNTKNKPRTLRMPDVYIPKSVGAKSKNYDILDLGSGEIYNLVEGEYLRDVEVFAGKGTSTPYRKAVEYAEEFNNDPEEWQHVKGKGILDYYGEERKAEIHWTQCEEFGRIDLFIKRWLE